MEKIVDHRKRVEMIMSMKGLSNYLAFSGEDEDYENGRKGNKDKMQRGFKGTHEELGKVEEKEERVVGK